ncbi:MAG: type II secretion system protein [Patescibacteria group bacterium]
MIQDSRKNGQALIEVIIGLFIAGILISAATAAIVSVLRSGLETKNFQVASSLGQELIDNAKTVAEADWHNVYSLSKGPDTQYYVTTSGTEFVNSAGFTTSVVGNITYTKFFSIENVKRLNGIISAEPSAVDDPSTQKIVSHIQWPSAGRTSEAVLTVYLSRWRNSISRQTDWSSGSGQEGPVSELNKKFFSSTDIDYSSNAGSLIIQGF